MKKVSVITAAFNSEATIRQTLDSFFNQTWPAKELILVDGGSNDATVDLARTYPQHEMLIISEPDNGLYDAINKGLALYSGDIFGVLHSDDCFHNIYAMERIVNALHTFDMVHGHVNYVQDHENRKLIRAWRAEAKPKSGFRSGWMPCHTSFFVNRDVQEMVGNFSLQYKISSDYDWMIRAIEPGRWTLKTLDHVLIDMKVGGMSTNGVGQYLKHNLESLKIRQKLLGSKFIDRALFLKPLRKLGQYFFADDQI